MDTDPHVEAQADHMEGQLEEFRSTLVTLGNKLRTPIDRAGQIDDVHELEDLADKVRFLLEDELEWMLQMTREMDEEARELKEEVLLDDEEDEEFSLFG